MHLVSIFILKNAFEITQFHFLIHYSKPKKNHQDLEVMRIWIFVGGYTKRCEKTSPKTPQKVKEKKADKPKK